MKNQNTKHKLVFNKAIVAELNDNQLIDVNGGSTIVGGETCSGCMCVSIQITVLKIQ